MNNDEKNTFISAMRNGFGLTKAAGFILKTPKEMSEILRANPALMKDVEAAVRYAAKAVLTMTTETLRERKFAKWKENRKEAVSFITQINLWECYCNKKELDQIRVAEALMNYKDKEEAATAMGLTSLELTQFLLMNPEVEQYLSQF